MGVFRQFPYSNFHEMNMDEIIKIVKNMLEEWAQYYAEWDAWMNQMNDDWSNYQEVMNEAWQNMQDFINNYFDNLDVQEEINNKITAMVESGEFSRIVNPYIPPAVTEWLAQHITQPTGVVIDTSLTVAGACADAKATGDEIDIVKGKLSDAIYGVDRTWTVATPSSTGSLWFYALLIKGQTYTFTNNTDNTCTLRLARADNSETLIQSPVNAGASVTFVVDDDDYIKFGGWYNGTGTISLVGGIGTDNIPTLLDDVDTLKTSTRFLNNDNYTLSDYSMMRITGIECQSALDGDFPSSDYDVSTDGDYIEVSGQSTGTRYIVLKVDMPKLEAGTYYIMTPNGTIGEGTYAVGILDKNKSGLIPTIYVNNALFGTITLTDDVEGIEYVSIGLLSTNHEYDLSGYVWISNSNIPRYSLLSQEGYQPKYRTRILFNVLEKQRVVSFGDSQTEQNKWQPLVADALGITSLVKGYGGYPVTPCDPNNQGFALSSDYILSQLEIFLTSNDFDIILIMGGTNDWAYDGVRNPNQSNILIGNDTDTTNATFKGALKKIVKTILTNHPTKQVILMSPIGGQTRETGVNLTEPMTNANGYTLGTFAKATADIAEYLGVPFIDVHECGITCFNSSSYLADGLHLNTSLGASAVANKVINGLLNVQNRWVVR